MKPETKIEQTTQDYKISLIKYRSYQVIHQVLYYCHN